jgi:hypothetical protein
MGVSVDNERRVRECQGGAQEEHQADEIFWQSRYHDPPPPFRHSLKPFSAARSKLNGAIIPAIAAAGTQRDISDPSIK